MEQTHIGFLAVLGLRMKDRKEELKAASIEPKDSELRERDFWSAIVEISRGRGSDRISTLDRSAIHLLEREVEKRFPEALYKRIRRHYDGSGGETYNLGNAIFFRVKIEGYGSVHLAVDVGGIRELTTLLGGNLDTFSMLMELCVPAAFADSLPNMELKSEDFQADIFPTKEFKSAFRHRQSSEPTQTSKKDQTSEATESRWVAKVPRALVATAFSLLTPVFLALVVFYFAAQMLLEERTNIAKREINLISEETALHRKR